MPSDLTALVGARGEIESDQGRSQRGGGQRGHMPSFGLLRKQNT